jgi:hypothetical protein
LGKVRHAEVGLGLLLVMVVLTPTAIAPAAVDDIALVPLMTADRTGIGIALVLVFTDLQVEKHFPWSPLV